MIRPQSPLLKLWVGNWVLTTQGIYNPTKTFTISHKSFKVNICNGVIGNCLLYLHSDKAQNDMTSWAAHSLKRDCRSN